MKNGKTKPYLKQTNKKKTTKYSCVYLTTTKGQDQMENSYAFLQGMVLDISLCPFSLIQLSGIFYVIIYTFLSIVETHNMSPAYVKV